MRAQSWLLVGCAVVLLGAGQALAQDPGGGKRSRGFGDPSQFFDKLSGGKDIWIRAEITDERRQMFFDKIAQSLGVTTGQISREQFTVGMQQLRANGPMRGPGGPAAPADPKVVEQDAERKFKDLDQNGDGYINPDEAARSKSLSAEFSRWDTNKDGLIDLNEYKAYYLERMQRKGQNDPGAYGAATIVPEPEEERRPVVYRFGNLPKELPAWFTELDLDKDGQIGLYEWRKAGKSVDEFEEMDRNNDGFLTAEEVLYYMAMNKKNADPAASQVASAAGQYGGPMQSPVIGARPGGRSGMPGGPGGGFGKRGPGGSKGAGKGGFKGKKTSGMGGN